MKTMIFIHGLESSSKGVKGKYFKENFPDMIIPDFVGSLEQRMNKLKDILKGKTNIIIVGSSYGGLMGTIFAMEQENTVNRLILLAPAINYLHMAVDNPVRINVPVLIYHGTKDDVIPLKDIKDVAKKIFSDLSFNMVDDDHYLHKTFFNIAWDKLLV